MNLIYSPANWRVNFLLDLFVDSSRHFIMFNIMDIFSPNIVDKLLNSYVLACWDSVKNLTKTSSKEVRISEIEKALSRAWHDKHRLQFFGYMFTWKLFYSELEDWYESIWNIVLEMELPENHTSTGNYDDLVVRLRNLLDIR